MSSYEMNRAKYKQERFEEQLSELSEWEGVPEAVKFTFRIVADLVKAQNEAILQLERKPQSNLQELETQVSEKAYNYALQKLATQLNFQEEPDDIEALKSSILQISGSLNHIKQTNSVLGNMKQELQEIQNKLETKVDYQQVSTMITKSHNELHKTFKDSHHELQEQRSNDLYFFEDEKRKTQEETNQRACKMEHLIRVLEDELSHFQDELKQVQISSSQLQKELQETQETSIIGFKEKVKRLETELEKVFTELDYLKDTKTSSEEFEKLIERKVEVRELQDSLDQLYEEVIREIRNNSEASKDFIKTTEKDLLVHIDKKPGLYEIKTLINDSVESFKELIYSAEEKRVDETSAFWKNINMIQNTLDNLHKELSAKANITEVFNILDEKVTYGEFNSAVEKLNQDLDFKCDVKEFESSSRRQSIINEALCAENCIARWIWKSGKVRSHYVPWEVQTANTCPENFLWEKGKFTVVAVAAGLYEVSYGFFCWKKPEVQLLVNGDVILQGGKTKLKSWGRNPAGNVSGLTNIEYLALPRNARISMTYHGELGSEAFLSLRKI